MTARAVQFVVVRTVFGSYRKVSFSHDVLVAGSVFGVVDGAGAVSEEGWTDSDFFSFSLGVSAVEILVSFDDLLSADPGFSVAPVGAASGFALVVEVGTSTLVTGLAGTAGLTTAWLDFGAVVVVAALSAC